MIFKFKSNNGNNLILFCFECQKKNFSFFSLHDQKKNWPSPSNKKHFIHSFVSYGRIRWKAKKKSFFLFPFTFCPYRIWKKKEKLPASKQNLYNIYIGRVRFCLNYYHYHHYTSVDFFFYLMMTMIWWLDQMILLDGML